MSKGRTSLVATRTRSRSERSWRRDMLARDLFIALCVKSKWPDLGPGISLEQERAVLAREALVSADVFEDERATFRKTKQKAAVR